MFVLNKKYDTDKKELSCGLVKKTDCNAKITEIDGKIPNISGLATNAALTVVENKIPDISGSVKKTETEGKLIIIIINTLQLQTKIL